MAENLPEDHSDEGTVNGDNGPESFLGPTEPDEVVVADVDELEEVIPFTYTITSFGADFLVDGLVNRLNAGDIVIPTYDPKTTADSGISGFQRGSVWTRPQMDRFIESLLLGLPVPEIFLVSEPNNVLLVLDGQQRLRTLRDFIGGITRGREYRLTNVQSQFRGKRFRDLDDEDRRRLLNSVIHATIVRQDTPSDDNSSIYMLFERLNTGGTLLQPQEMRVALFRGPLMELLRELNEFPAWRALYGPQSKRLKDQELILRFFAFLHMGSDYQRPMKEFLNTYAGENRDLNRQSGDRLRNEFTETTTAILDNIGHGAFRLASAQVNAALLDSLMVGIAERLSAGPITDKDATRAAYDRLLEDNEYLAAVQRSTADEDRVNLRLSRARSAFQTVP